MPDVQGAVGVGTDVEYLKNASTKHAAWSQTMYTRTQARTTLHDISHHAFVYTLEFASVAELTAEVEMLRAQARLAAGGPDVCVQAVRVLEACTEG